MAKLDYDFKCPHCKYTIDDDENLCSCNCCGHDVCCECTGATEEEPDIILCKSCYEDKIKERALLIMKTCPDCHAPLRHDAPCPCKHLFRR